MHHDARCVKGSCSHLSLAITVTTGSETRARPAARRRPHDRGDRTPARSCGALRRCRGGPHDQSRDLAPRRLVSCGSTHARPEARRTRRSAWRPSWAPLVPRSASATWSARGGGVVIDSPGIRGIGLAGDEESIDAACAGIHEAGVHCRFRDCGHEDEPECAVTRAVWVGAISAEQLHAYRYKTRPSPLHAAPTPTNAEPTYASSYSS